ncbi:MAG: lysogenization regulator HflD [Gammaproteobacteria bacterium]|nr:MAG: lysogenization regulator HflD [Gammaproteobacteria bacterium]
MSHTLADQTLALAGIFQAAALVRQIAHNGSCHPISFETSIKSIYIQNPETTIDVYGSHQNLNFGLHELLDTLDQDSQKQKVEVIRYVLNLIHLENKLKKNPELLDIIGKRIGQAREQLKHFDLQHSNVIKNLASIYTDTISTFNLRIQVTGKPQHLKINDNADRIRALLLAGIRSAMLWRQLGGRRWQLIFRRKAVWQKARKIVKTNLSP